MKTITFETVDGGSRIGDPINLACILCKCQGGESGEGIILIHSWCNCQDTR